MCVCLCVCVFVYASNAFGAADVLFATPLLPEIIRRGGQGVWGSGVLISFSIRQIVVTYLCSCRFCRLQLSYVLSAFLYLLQHNNTITTTITSLTFG